MTRTSEIAQTGGAGRQIVLVSGMHRSGTSALTRVCNLLGGALPQPLVEPAIGNELGHWEPAEVVAMNDRALLAAGSDVNSVFPVSPRWLASPAARAFTGEVEGYVSALGPAPLTWFVKDPRISVLAGPWREGVENAGATPRFVIAFRNPWEVAASLTKRQLHHFPHEVWPLERGLALWLNYVLAVERASRGLPRSFVGYEAFLGDWRGEIRRVHEQTGLPPPVMGEAECAAVDQFVKPSERHARHDASRAQGLAMRVYDLLRARVADPDGGQGAFDEAGEAFAMSFDVLGGYLAALERRAAEAGRMSGRVKEADDEIGRLQHIVDASERRIAHLARRPEEPQSSAPDAAFAELQKKHEALKAAHRENVAAFKAKAATLDAEVERQRQSIALALDEKDAAITALQTSLRDAEQRVGQAWLSPRVASGLASSLLRKGRRWLVHKPLNAMLALAGRRRAS